MPPLTKPLLIYDGDCGFCRRWIRRWQSFTEDRIEYAPFQEIEDQFHQIPIEDFRNSVQLIELNGKVFSGAEAVFRALAQAPGKRWMLWVYEGIPGFRFLSEWFYRFVAQHRVAFSRLTRLFWGDDLEPSTYFLSRDFFLRVLGAIYFVAFVSFWTQASGLIGQNGILPARGFLEAVGKQVGVARYWLLPTLCWLHSSDGFIHLLCAAGAFLSLLLVAGFTPAPILFVLWICYLSLVSVGQDFMEFQWDGLLLETGFLAIFLAPLTLRLRSSRRSPPSSAVLWLLRWLLFRLIFSSGMVKLASGDPTWRSLAALQFHYETQPLPTWIGWYAHQWPGWFQKISCLLMFGVELGVPFLIFAPRRLRHFGCLLLIAFQLLIAATGNYCFFNLLTMALCLLLVDDLAWGRFRKEDKTPVRFWPQGVIVPLTGVILLVTSVQMVQLFGVRTRWLFPIALLYEGVAPFRSINGYGLFAVMTTSRPEIIVEGSEDGSQWLAYEFKWKPGDLRRHPRFVAPHQPRLDWQMWFAALGRYRSNPWFLNFCFHLLQGSPEVLKLVAKNPFPDHPPRYLRAMLYDYHFTDFATRKAEGTWWRREPKGLYCPVLSLQRT